MEARPVIYDPLYPFITEAGPPMPYPFRPDSRAPTPAPTLPLEAVMPPLPPAPTTFLLLELLESGI